MTNIKTLPKTKKQKQKQKTKTIIITGLDLNSNLVAFLCERCFLKVSPESKTLNLNLLHSIYLRLKLIDVLGFFFFFFLEMITTCF